MKNLKEILEINEDYKVPDTLMQILLDDKKRNDLFEQFEAEDLERDFFREYFETNQADRKSFMQDFTPDCIGEVIKEIVGEADSVADICSGTGGLSIKVWANNPKAKYSLEEFSTAALPFLLFNMAIRNVQGYVLHKNALTKETYAIYALQRGEKHSEITMEMLEPETKSEIVISNPPYSQKWEDVENYKDDECFKEYGLPPKSKADYGFLLRGYSQLKPQGITAAILPHGVLFRGQKEGDIRKKLLQSGAVETIIGLPENLFKNTAIPVAILVLRKNRTTRDVFFIDASREFEKLKNINNLTDEHIRKILDTYRNRKDVNKYAHLASYEEIEENDFNLNISRYVDTYEKEELPPIDEIMKEIRDAHHEAIRIEDNLLAMTEELVEETEEADKQLKQTVKDFKCYIEERKKRELYELRKPEIHVGRPEYKRVSEIAEIERANKGKIYRAGSTLIPMSAVSESDVPQFLKTDGEVGDRYAVITFTIPHIPYTMWQLICGAFPKFVHRYATGMNLQADALKFLNIPVYTLNDQMEIARNLWQQEEIIKNEEILIKKWETFKKTLTEAILVNIKKSLEREE